MKNMELFRHCLSDLHGHIIVNCYCDNDKRSFYEKECSNSKWSIRELRRQIGSSLYERLLLSNADINIKKVMELAHKGNEIIEPIDIIKEPYVFEFLDLPENKPLMESDLEHALVVQIEKVLCSLDTTKNYLN